jgi:hypothetical protein
MYDGNPVYIHTGRYPRGIDVSNFKWKFKYFVPEEKFYGGGVQIWWPFVSDLLSIHVQTLNVTFWFFPPVSCGHRFQQSEDTQKS